MRINIDEVPQELRDISRDAIEEISPNALMFLIGGAVRDLLLGVMPNDYDVEIRANGITLLKLRTILERYGKVSQVNDNTLRLRTKEHKEFDLSMYSAASPSIFSPNAPNRDFTINAMAILIRNGVVVPDVIDSFNGVQHLELRLLQHVDDDTFSTDMSRVLRGMNLASRYKLKPSAWHSEYLKKRAGMWMSVPAEKRWQEWQKWAHTPYPAFGIAYIRKVGWLGPHGLLNLVGVKQSPLMHPEGDVFIHTLATVQRAAELGRGLSHTSREILVFSALLHDLGKKTAIDKENHPHAHPEIGAHKAEEFLRRIRAPKYLMKPVVSLVERHMAYSPKDKADQKQIRRMSARINADLSLLFYLIEADHTCRLPFGRPEITEQTLKWLESAREVAQELSILNEKESPLIQGRDLITIGMPSGPEMGEILRELHQMQEDSIFDSKNDGMRIAKRLVQEYTENAEKSKAANEAKVQTA